MTDRELIAFCADVLKSAREASIFTLPPGRYPIEVIRRINLALALCEDHAAKIPTLTEEIRIDE